MSIHTCKKMFLMTSSHKIIYFIPSHRWEKSLDFLIQRLLKVNDTGLDKHLLIIMVPHTSLISFKLDIIHSYPVQVQQSSARGEKGNENRWFGQNLRPKVKGLELGRLFKAIMVALTFIKSISIIINCSIPFQAQETSISGKNWPKVPDICKKGRPKVDFSHHNGL